MENHLSDYSSLFIRGYHIQVIWRNQSINLQKVGGTRAKIKYICLGNAVFVFSNHFCRSARNLKFHIKTFRWLIALTFRLGDETFNQQNPGQLVTDKTCIAFQFFQLYNFFLVFEDYFIRNVRGWFFLENNSPRKKFLKWGVNFAVWCGLS